MQIVENGRYIASRAVDSLRNKALLEREVGEVKEMLEGRLDHVLVIPDGNRRFAKKMGMNSVSEGHEAGAAKGFELLDIFMDLDVDYVTAWGLSQSNFKRPQEELEALFRIQTAQVRQLRPYLARKNGRFEHRGRRDRLPEYLLDEIDVTHAATEKNTGPQVTFLLDYGAAYEERMLVAGVVDHIKRGTLGEVTDERAAELRRESMGCLPPVQLVFRTGENEGGLVHLSQLGVLIEDAYIFPLKKTFPELTARDVIRGLKAYATARINAGA